MAPPRFFYPDTPDLPLPAGHRFPISKYRLMRERVSANKTLGNAELVASPATSLQQLLRAHSPDYVAAVLDGTLPREAQRQIGLPWSATLVRRSRATVGGSVAAAREAIAHGVSGQLAGGTHHAHHSYGSGFCVFNDLAVATLDLLHTAEADRIAILDLDVHQGDGNATILAPIPAAFVASVHGERNFPFDKATSDLDIALADGTDDGPYLSAVADAADAVFAFRPDLILYLAGVDPLDADSLGRLSVSAAGLAARDAYVLSECHKRGMPVAVVAGGGYARPVNATVDAYVSTWAAVREEFAL